MSPLIEDSEALLIGETVPTFSDIEPKDKNHHLDASQPESEQSDKKSDRSKFVQRETAFTSTFLADKLLYSIIRCIWKKNWVPGALSLASEPFDSVDQILIPDMMKSHKFHSPFVETNVTVATFYIFFH